MSPAPLLALEGVEKTYSRGMFDRAPVFHLRIDKRFHHPQIVGVMGPNGAGKTTLFEMMAGSNAPSRGAIRIAGQDIHAVRYRERDRMAIHYHQSYQVRRFRKTKPAFIMDRATSVYPLVHLFDEPQFNLQDGYIGFMLSFFRKLKSDKRLVFICLHPTAPFQLDILKDVCDSFLFVAEGGVASFASLHSALSDSSVCAYLGALADRREMPTT